jgi:hypothetical protein
LLGATENAQATSFTSSPSVIGGIGAGLAILILALAILGYVITKKRKERRKQNDDKVESLEELRLSEDSISMKHSPLFVKVNPSRISKETNINISRLSSSSQEGTVNVLETPSYKYSFLPSNFNGQSLQKAEVFNNHKNKQLAVPLDTTKNKQLAVPLDIYKAVSPNNNRMSIKRNKLTFREPIIDTKMSFQPIKKEWRPILARDDTGSQKANSDTQLFNIIFQKK